MSNIKQVILERFNSFRIVPIARFFSLVDGFREFLGSKSFSDLRVAWIIFLVYLVSLDL
jgi:hypothetical protein